MRLINADKLLQEIAGEENQQADRLMSEWYTDMVKRQPTAYDLDAVIRQLEDLRDEHIDMQCCPYVDDDEMSCIRCYMEKAIEIVNKIE